jgi:hypothetical protein
MEFMALSVYFQDYADYSMNELTVGKTAQIGLSPTSWDLREDCFEFGANVVDNLGRSYWQPYDKAGCIEAWLKGELNPDIMVRCLNAPGFTKLSRYRELPDDYKPFFR